MATETHKQKKASRHESESAEKTPGGRDGRAVVLTPDHMDCASLKRFAFHPDVSFEEMQSALVDAGAEIHKLRLKSMRTAARLRHVLNELCQLAEELRDEEYEQSLLRAAVRTARK
jgi:hypothetical protein